MTSLKNPSNMVPEAINDDEDDSFGSIIQKFVHHISSDSTIKECLPKLQEIKLLPNSNITTRSISKMSKKILKSKVRTKPHNIFIALSEDEQLSKSENTVQKIEPKTKRIIARRKVPLPKQKISKEQRHINKWVNSLIKRWGYAYFSRTYLPSIFFTENPKWIGKAELKVVKGGHKNKMFIRDVLRFCSNFKIPTDERDLSPAENEAGLCFKDVMVHILLGMGKRDKIQKRIWN